MKKRFILVLGLTLFFTGCEFTSSDKQESVPEKKSLYEKVLKNKKIRVGYIAYPPNFIKNPDGTYGGIFYEAMEEIGKKLGLEIDYTEEVTWGGMIEAIKTKRIDMVVTGIWPTSARGKHVDFANPLFFSVVKAYTQIDNNKFDGNLKTLNNKNVKISTIDGEMTSIIANMDFPDAQKVPVAQMLGVAQTLLDVQTKKTDVTFVEPAIALEFDVKNPNSIKEIANIKPLRVFPNAMMLPKDEEEFKTMLNVAINELINNGYIDRYIDKYEKYPNSFYRVQVPYRIK